MTEDSGTVKLVEAVRRARHVPLMRDLGVPGPHVAEDRNAPDPALVWLHLGAAYLKLSVIAGLVAAYCARTGLAMAEFGYGADLIEAGNAAGARDRAADHYREAEALDPTLAEAQFALARVAQLGREDLADIDEPLARFRRCIELPVHEAAPGHAHLHANAHWEAACLLEDAGRTDEALEHFRDALSRLDTFGVHHVRVARFFRRLGLQEEAAEQYLVCARYTHRYCPEFALPPLEPAPAAPPAPRPEEVMALPEGGRVYFHQGQYVLVPPEIGALDAEGLDAALRSRDREAAGGGPGALIGRLGRLLRPTRPRPPVRSAASIAELVA